MIIAFIFVLLAMLLLIIRAILGTTIYDRILAVNTFGNTTVAAIVLITYLSSHYDYLDVALVYALINFITTIAFLKFFNPESFEE